MSKKRLQATVFLDRDGTLNHDTNYIKTPKEFVLFPDTLAAVKQCNGAGIRVMVVTNQSGLARGYFSQIPPSSPSFALFKDGELVFMYPRHFIEGRTPQIIGADLVEAFEEYL